MNSIKSKFYLQSKNGNHSGWRTIGIYKDLGKASAACVGKMKNNRGKPGYEWYKTRVITKEQDTELSGRTIENRVYPPQKKQGE